MIRVEIGDLTTRGEEAVLRPVRSDLAPVTVASRELGTRAGPDLARRLDAIGRIPVGGAVITPAGDLATSFLIHVVTSAEDEPQTPLSVQRSVRNGLRRAADWGVASLALPPLGISVGTMEAEDAARSLVEMLVDHLAEGAPPLDLVVVVSSAYEEQIFSNLVSELTRDRELPGADVGANGGATG